MWVRVLSGSHHTDATYQLDCCEIFHFLNILDDLPRDANELASESSSYDWYVLSHLKRKSVGDHHVDHHVRSNSQKIQKMGDMCKSRSTKTLQEVAPARFKWIYNLHNCNNIILQRSYSTK